MDRKTVNHSRRQLFSAARSSQLFDRSLQGFGGDHGDRPGLHNVARARDGVSFREKEGLDNVDIDCGHLGSSLPPLLGRRRKEEPKITGDKPIRSLSVALWRCVGGRGRNNELLSSNQGQKPQRFFLILAVSSDCKSSARVPLTAFPVTGGLRT